MSIFGIGVDLVNAKRIQLLYQKYGDRFPKRILDDNEMQLFENSKNKNAIYAMHLLEKKQLSKHLALDFRKVFTGKILV